MKKKITLPAGQQKSPKNLIASESYSVIDVIMGVLEIAPGLYWSSIEIGKFKS